MLICVDKKRKFVGVLNDGDIRRAILKGAKIKQPIKRFIVKEATTLNMQSSLDDANKLLSNRILIIPVLNFSNEVIGYYSIKDKIENVLIKSNDVLVVGMGYVGLTLAATLSSIGLKVIGYDNNPKIINDLNRGIIPFYEKGLKKYIKSNTNKNLIFTNKLKKNLASTIVITVGTPLKRNKKEPDLSSIKNAANSIGEILEENNLVILRSTLTVGCTRKTVIPNLEKKSKLKAGKDFYVSFAPERTAEGRAMIELRENPQIIGGLNEVSSQLTANLFNRFTHSIINVKSLEHAEFCKLIDNCYRDHKFSFINQMIGFSEKQNIDLCEIVNAVNHGYKRNDIPMPSPGVGGPCLTKDPYILLSNFKEKKIKNNIIKSARNINESIPKYLFNKLKKMFGKLNKKINNSKIFILGIAFKGEPETSDLRSSTSVDFIKLLPASCKLHVYDPVAKPDELKKLGTNVNKIEQGFKNADAVLIMNNHKSFQEIDLTSLAQKMKKPSIFIDTWKVFDPLEVKQIKGLFYGGLGIE